MPFTFTFLFQTSLDKICIQLQDWEGSYNRTQDRYDSPRKADGETVPLLRETITLMPVSTKGTENSTTSDLSSLMVSEPMAMSARLDTTY